MKVLILGASGMIGSAMFRVLSQSTKLHVQGTVRSAECLKYFTTSQRMALIPDIDILLPNSLVKVFDNFNPDVVINAIGLTKHHLSSEDALLSIPLNALLPHRLSILCQNFNSRLIHISTDCVFSGFKGNYLESDQSDASDLYGKTKHLGELMFAPHVLILRTSTIGHELCSHYGLLEWFLHQQVRCSGFAKAIFSGLPNNVFAEVLRDQVLPNVELHGLYHLGASSIDKFELLKLIAHQYSKDIFIDRNQSFVINRSLNSSRFYEATGYRAPPWSELIASMFTSYRS